MTNEEQSEDKKGTRGEQCQDKKQTARAERRKKTRSEKSGSKQCPENLPEKPRSPLRFWKNMVLMCPGGTHPSPDGPGVPAADGRLDPEVLIGTDSRTAEVAPLGFLKNPHRHSRGERQAQEDLSRRPADAKEEEDCGQQTPWDARNQEGARAEGGHALESVATPGTGSG
ncbi:hypothetical protein NDU88_009621 [Pleurodeles waltl]|uniref:Uncharacterized protein n=1 Tax=Pleurodeles waltl TaxID=8319 RepID=A0AAV7PXQ3_PLEWA|nr:hypothetical protein NDU88_009621 [Pleurodeles waltl]